MRWVATRGHTFIYIWTCSHVGWNNWRHDTEKQEMLTNYWAATKYLPRKHLIWCLAAAITFIKHTWMLKSNIDTHTHNCEQVWQPLRPNGSGSSADIMACQHQRKCWRPDKSGVNCGPLACSTAVRSRMSTFMQHLLHSVFAEHQKKHKNYLYSW